MLYQAEPRPDRRIQIVSANYPITKLPDYQILDREGLDRRKRMMRRQIRVQRRHRHVAVAHRLVVRPIVRLPLVLPFFDPVVRAPFGSCRSATDVT